MHSSMLQSSVPYYNTVLRAGLLPGQAVTVTGTIISVFGRSDLWSELLIWIVLAIFISHILWVVETRQKNSDFRDFYPLGLWDGFYWSAVTSSTVGYGDKAPKSACGKCSGIIWMLFSFFFSVTVAATLTSLMVINQTNPPPVQITDFRALTTGVIRYSPAIPMLNGINSNIMQYSTLAEAFSALQNFSVNILLLDQPSMSILNTTTTCIVLNGPPFGDLTYAFNYAESFNDSTIMANIDRSLNLYKYTESFDSLTENYFNSTIANSIFNIQTTSLSTILLISWACILFVFLIFALVVILRHRYQKHKGTEEKEEKKEEMENSPP